MPILHQPDCQFNSPSPRRCRRRSRGRKPSRTGERALQVAITSSAEQGVAFYAAVIYRGQTRLHSFEGWLETTAERAWLFAYALVCEYRDAEHPDCRLAFRESIDAPRAQERRRAA